MELIIIENQKPKKILQLPVLGGIEEKVQTVNINNNLRNQYKNIIKIKTKKMEHKILIMCMLMMLFSCKKRDKLIFRIIKEVEGIKKVQYLCLEKKRD